MVAPEKTMTTETTPQDIADAWNSRAGRLTGKATTARRGDEMGTREDMMKIEAVAMAYIARVAPPLGGGGGMPAQSHEDAVEWIYRHAADDGCDARQIELGIDLGIDMIADEDEVAIMR